jgi:hypothetical protein
MAEHPEMPFLLAGALALTGGIAREKGWPPEGLKALIGTGVLVVVASITAGTSFAPLIRAIGLLLVLASGMATITALQKASGKKK